MTKTYEFQTAMQSLRLSDNFNLHYVITIPPNTPSTPFDTLTGDSHINRISLSMFKMATTFDPVIELSLSLDNGSGAWESIPLMVCRSYDSFMMYMAETASEKKFKIKGLDFKLSNKTLLTAFFYLGARAEVSRTLVTNMGVETREKQVILDHAKKVFRLMGRYTVMNQQ